MSINRIKSRRLNNHVEIGDSFEFVTRLGHNPHRFSFNLSYGVELENVLFHIDFRNTESKVVLNYCVNRGWNSVAVQYLNAQKRYGQGKSNFCVCFNSLYF